MINQPVQPRAEQEIKLRQKVVIRIREDKEKLKQRMCLSEHPFGTVK
jgi:transposase